MTDSVLIIGGGPAGLALAIVLARAGVDVWVAELSDYTAPRIGEHLPPSGIQALNRLVPHRRLSDEIHLRSHGVDAYWGDSNPSQMDYLFHPIGVGANLSRPKFDRDLAFDCREAGAQVALSAILVSADWRRTHWLATLKLPSRLVELRPKLIVDATGRSAHFARRQGAKVLASDRQIALVNLQTSRTAFAERGRVLIEATESGWWYRAPLVANQSITQYMTDADLLPRGGKAKLREWWINQIRKTHSIGPEMGDSQVARAHLLLRWARSQRLSHTTGEGWIAVGDAAFAFDPLASQGITKALEGAQHSGDIVLRHLSGNANAFCEYADWTAEVFHNYEKLRHGYYLTEMRWPLAPFWQRRHCPN